MRIMKDLLKGLTVLLVEDEPDLLDVMSAGLQTFGANVIEASNGFEGLEQFEKNHVDVILSDVRMPGGDGVALLEAIRSRNQKNPPFFFLTGYSDVTRDRAIAKGAQGMMYKPIGIPTLAQTLLSAVRGA